MIDFSLTPKTLKAIKIAHKNAEYVRTLARYYDENEHAELKEDEKEQLKKNNAALLKVLAEPGQGEGQFLTNIILGEERSWGDPVTAGAIATAGLGNAAIRAVATPEQKARFDNLFCAMAITEPGFGSDTSAVATTAKLDPETKEWIINGEKIFVTSGKRCNAVVVWATLDKSKGRAAIKSFVVEKFRKGMTLTKLEHKLGIRVSDTASIVFEDCRIPYDNILGSPEIKEAKGGQVGVLATFDATRPGVAAQGIGVGRAALEFTKGETGRSRGYLSLRPRHSFLERGSERNTGYGGQPGSGQAAGLTVGIDARQGPEKLAGVLHGKSQGRQGGITQICQRCVALLGPLGYSRDWLVEKWMRDCQDQRYLRRNRSDPDAGGLPPDPGI